MKKNILIPIVLLTTTPFVVSCTKKPTDMPPPPPVTGTTETIAPTQTGANSVITPIQTGTTTSGTTSSVAPVSLTRTETVSYTAPAPDAMAEVEFSVTVTDGIITSATATPKTEKQASRYNQDNFMKDLSAKVVGKKAKDLDVDAIGGASLTTAAFETFVHSF